PRSEIFGENPESDTRAARALQSLCGEFFFDEAVQMIANHRVIEAWVDFVQKAGDEKTLGNFGGDAAGAQIEKFVFIDLTGGRPVCATDVVGENFEAGH